ncbi:hypothetical protein AMATHDRAFT_61202 [Amanita thiersii Skay4041]|uniref:F-box domain-containing protein n=1 Tax=Amanita thiersii Skay4041 TaxID=703135 RepID=A0A2A9NRJ9_9AGAR|nr:hypothetical protein AMATHDRAFT_61202 [Amanita thiersii Skay4041]
MSSPSVDELTNTVCTVVQTLPQSRKAKFLLNTALSLIDDGHYGPEVENYLDIYLKSPNLPRSDVVKALLARGNARRRCGERLLAKAQQDFQAVHALDPTNREIQHHFRRDKLIHFTNEPASQRAPLEVWERIAHYIPRYHLRSWLFVSALHRDIAMKRIFHTIDIYFGEDQESLNRGLDIFDRAKADPIFASRVKCLRLHWSYEEGDMLDLMIRIFRTALPEFKALRDFEWIGYPEMRADMVKAVLASHSHLHSLGLIGWHFDAVGVSAFKHLRKFTLRAEDDDGFADMGEVRTVLDQNEGTLRHLILGAYLARTHSWDSAFQSVTIKNLTHLDLVDTRISHIVLARIAHAHNLQSLTLHGTFEEPSSASVVFGSDHIIDRKHTFLPHLEAFRFVLVGHDDELNLYQSVVQFLRQRTKLRRLDLGSCPWELVLSVLPDLTNLRVLGVRIANLTQATVDTLVNVLPNQICAIHLSTAVSDKSMNEYARVFARFHCLSFLHLQCVSKRRPKPNLVSEKDYQVQTDLWYSNARHTAILVPSVDFIGWHGEHYVVVRTDGPDGKPGGNVELKELPTRRRLDCGKGVDLGTDDATWLERKDVPMDYEMPGLE